MTYSAGDQLGPKNKSAAIMADIAGWIVGRVDLVKLVDKIHGVAA